RCDVGREAMSDGPCEIQEPSETGRQCYMFGSNTREREACERACRLRAVELTPPGALSVPGWVIALLSAMGGGWGWWGEEDRPREIADLPRRVQDTVRRRIAMGDLEGANRALEPYGLKLAAAEEAERA